MSGYYDVYRQGGPDVDKREIDGEIYFFDGDSGTPLRDSEGGNIIDSEGNILVDETGRYHGCDDQYTIVQLLGVINQWNTITKSE